MPHAFPSLGMLQRPGGQTPWSARVPLDPLSVRGIRYLPGRCATRGSRADEGVRPTTYRWRSEREEGAASACRVGSLADVPFGDEERSRCLSTQQARLPAPRKLLRNLA